MDKREFINLVKEGALKSHSDYGILTSLTIAQAILESAWGSSKLSQRANNLFGVKATSSWPGKRITMVTAEWYGDKRQIVRADFRAYESFNASIEDHNKLLSLSRYKPVRECSDYKTACRKIYVGSKGKAVEFIQQLVGAAPVDGDFGAITRSCVIEYQRNKNIEADGIIGPKTWLSLITT